MNLEIEIQKIENALQHLEGIKKMQNRLNESIHDLEFSYGCLNFQNIRARKEKDKLNQKAAIERLKSIYKKKINIK